MTESSPYLEAGRPTRRVESALSYEDLARLFRGLSSNTVVPFSQFSRNPTAAVLLRIDAVSGLTRAVAETCSLAREQKLDVLLALSPFAAGDLLTAKEGRATFDPRLASLISKWITAPTVAPASGLLARWPRSSKPRSDNRTLQIALLNELADAFLATGRNPWRVYAEIAQDMARHGLKVEGIVTPEIDQAATELSLLLSRNGYGGELPQSVFEPYGTHGAELYKPDGRSVPDLTDLDIIESVSVVPRPEPRRRYSRRLMRPVVTEHYLERSYRADWVVTSSSNGWHLRKGRRDRGLSHDVASQLIGTDALVEFVDKHESMSSVAIIFQPEHFQLQDIEPMSRSPTFVRELPAPFDTYFTISSDVDWSTPRKVLACQHFLNEYIGLPISGSFFVRASASYWIGALDRSGGVRGRDDESGFLLEDAFAKNWFDTVHSWTEDVFVRELFWDEGASTFVSPNRLPLKWGAGFIVKSRRPRLTVALVLDTASEPESHALEPTLAPSKIDCQGHYQMYFSVPSKLCERTEVAENSTWALSVEPSELEAVVEVTFTDFSPLLYRQAAQELVTRHVHPTVFNSHGKTARDVANLRAPVMKEREPKATSLDMDEPASVAYLLDALCDLGVTFVSIIGAASTPRLMPRAQLLWQHTFANGQMAYAYRRFVSRRAGGLGLGDWQFDKGMAHAPALGFQVLDVLQRLAWAKPGSGAVLYTHFGHVEGNQVDDDLGWSAESRQCLRRLAANYHPDGEETASIRPWVAPTSIILRQHVVAHGLVEHAHAVDNRIVIKGWYDPCIGIELPSTYRHGTRLLHGQCFIVDDAESAVVEAEGRPITSLARLPARIEELPTVTVVDDTQPAPFLIEGNVRRISSKGAAVRFAGSRSDWREHVIEILTNAQDFDVTFDLPTHALGHQDAWMIDVKANSMEGLALKLRDGRGQYYEASQTHHAQWPLMSGVPRDSHGWQRLVFQFSARRGHDAGPPHRGITALCLQGRCQQRGSSFLLRQAALLQPTTHKMPIPTHHYLAGQVAAPSWHLAQQEIRIEVADDRGAIIANVPADKQGSFEAGLLQRNRMFTVTGTSAKGRWHSWRGNVFVATRDCWDWRITIWPGEAHI